MVIRVLESRGIRTFYLVERIMVKHPAVNITEGPMVYLA